MKLHRCSQTLLIFLISILPFHSAYSSKRIVFQDLDLEKAKEKSIKESKLIYINFTADWCMACKTIENTLYQDEEIVHLINEYFVPVNADVESFDGIDWNLHYNSSYLPTIILAAKNGNEFQRFKGIPERAVLLEALNKLKPISALDENMEYPSPKNKVTPSKPIIKVLPTPKNENDISIQLGAFSSMENANRFISMIEDKNIHGATIETINLNGKQLFKVLINEFRNKQAALEKLNAIKSKGLDCFIR